eukprot:CAMPEP_0119171694 /NCGR_PEP_ID=MMETSP1315-20130426/25893_1 /TAXON_ID=676789 /ORGANISM="Prasinoderma singularis, Strain RCC927" /LENGTH=73 /DNA_ID=CAMNT_0007165557 /DNA_START=330 /DNA_END=548 /DNA_ORIENTATION=+
METHEVEAAAAVHAHSSSRRASAGSTSWKARQSSPCGLTGSGLLDSMAFHESPVKTRLAAQSRQSTSARVCEP